MPTTKPFPPIEALIFDMDGLLVDSEPLTGIALEELLHQHACRIDWDDKALTARLMGRRMSEILTVLAEICGMTTPADELNDTLEDLRIQTLRGQLQTMPGAAELLAFAAACGLSLALATSGRRSYVDAVLAETRLTGCFSVEVTGEDVMHGKPHPETYVLAASRLCMEPAVCVVLEDAPNGVAAAVAAGMRSIAIPNVYTRNISFLPPPEITLPDLHTVIPWLRLHGCQGASSRGSPSGADDVDLTPPRTINAPGTLTDIPAVPDRWFKAVLRQMGNISAIHPDARWRRNHQHRSHSRAYRTLGARTGRGGSPRERVPMSHVPSHLEAFLAAQGAVSRSRRGLLRGGLGLGIVLAGRCVAQPLPAQAAMAVQVGSPRITRIDDCLTDVSVTVTFGDVSAEHRYHVYGDVLEADTGEDDAEFCCTLRRQGVVLLPGQSRSVTLKQQAMAVDLGLVRGLGPAADETFSPNLVELFARIWLHDFTTDEVLGPWDSPQRIAVSRSLPGLMLPASLQDNPLMTPRGSAPVVVTAIDGRSLPPLPCAS